jgi:hypothetical protein
LIELGLSVITTIRRIEGCQCIPLQELGMSVHHNEERRDVRARVKRRLCITPRHSYLVCCTAKYLAAPLSWGLKTVHPSDNIIRISRAYTALVRTVQLVTVQCALHADKVAFFRSTRIINLIYICLCKGVGGRGQLSCLPRILPPPPPPPSPHLLLSLYCPRVQIRILG